ncbi:3'(2'),5'-bisphosphate nucleotidase [Entomomonas moraniae]|uniref:3'(2'),5'-bisphosphate nucleotidase CysQ n=1 Tax=Entomomonas moraniae TaxID=2213226 RepID=A0A3Q9JKL7_9GAMM|nr:3'(2'),5'-bisphosphate nucleotidase CysQ [Entomomonas moraniae]AZS51784.1 3'(2'),5'-bisphosphate nucleotidase [Entomomonas moraniae]
MPDELIPDIVAIAKEAGKATLKFWQKDIEVNHKLDDSPVTKADLAANHIIIEHLTKLTPHIPILSEEACSFDYTTRKNWKQWWLIDPLDGTKEFIAGSGDFTINIALINDGHVHFGVVFIPVTAICYVGGKSLGAWRIDDAGTKQAIRCSNFQTTALQVIASQRHSSQKQQLFLEQLAALAPFSLKNAGSSLKFCLIAEGQADCYPRFAPTCQWDTAAAQGILEGAGGNVFNENGDTLSYEPRKDYLNPNFIALGDSNTWQKPIFELIKKLP